MKYQYLNCLDGDFKFVKAIRKSVFTKEQGIAVSEDIDEFDADVNTLYVLVCCGQKAVSTGRLIHMPYGYKIGRIATLKEYRGQGYGAVLINALCQKAKEYGAAEVHLESQLHAIPFYLQSGFEIVSDEIIIDRGIEHKKMIKRF